MPAPILRWAGSKRKLLPKLLPYWGKGHHRYVEPFAGSAALFFAIQPKTAVLADVNLELIEALTVVRDNPEEVHDWVTRYPVAKRTFYELRAVNPKAWSRPRRAARFIYLNRFCFNGLYRTDLAGRFNVPFGETKNNRLPSVEAFTAAASALRSTKLMCSDFEATITKEVRKGDFVYLDPPYAVSNRKIFRQYGPQSFGLDDLQRLSSMLDEIEKRGGLFVLSYAYCREAMEAFKGWPSRRFLTHRNIAGFVKKRRRAVELVFTNILN